MNRFIKQLFCGHQYVFYRNIYGDEIVSSGWKRSIDKCVKCGKLKWFNHLQTKGENKKMTNKFSKVYDEQRLAKEFGIPVEHSKMYDTRYKVPKESPKTTEDLIDKTIAETEIYRRARVAISLNQDIESEEIKLDILKAQRKQVGYGIDKYPEPLNANTWSVVETIDHTVDESIDKLHYLIMLRIKFEQCVLEKGISDILKNIDNMISETTKTLHYLFKLRIEIGQTEADKPKHNDYMDSARYSTYVADAVTAVSNSVKLSGVDMDGDYVHGAIYADGVPVNQVDIDDVLDGKLESWSEVELRKAGLK